MGKNKSHREKEKNVKDQHMQHIPLTVFTNQIWVHFLAAYSNGETI